MKKFLKIYFIALIVITLLLLVVHTFTICGLIVDNISIFLLIIMALLPFVTVIKKFKWGDFEAEIGSDEIKDIKDSVDKTIAKEKPKEKELASKSIEGYTQEEVQEVVEYLIDLADIDPVLAIAKLRVELEKLIRGIYLHHGGEDKRSRSIGYMTNFLIKKDDFDSEELESARKIIDVSNRVLHGEKIDKREAKIMVFSAVKLLNYITGYSKALDEFGMLKK
tara:strand:- start:107 stop:772 length:666 start_codon:yes stop_codon:yes gene_type:complete